MTMRLSAALLTLLAAAPFVARAAAKPPQLPLDQKITCEEPPLVDPVQRIGIDFEIGPPGPVMRFGNPPPAIDDRPGCGRGFRQMIDCMLFGIHPATALLRGWLIDFNGEPCLPLGKQPVPIADVLGGAAEVVACTGCHPLQLAWAGWWAMTEAPPADDRPVGRINEINPSRFINGLTPADTFTSDLDVAIVPAGYELIAVPPVEYEELTVPPTEVEPIPVMPVEEKLQPFAPPEIDAGGPNTGSFLLGVGINSDAGLISGIVLNERNFDAGCPDERPGCPLLPGLCIDIDWRPDCTRLRGQLQFGCFTLRLDHADGHGTIALSMVLPDAADPHAEQVDHNERILRWIDGLNAGCLGGAVNEETCEPPRE
jgi:hypothetical protein